MTQVLTYAKNALSPLAHNYQPFPKQGKFGNGHLWAHIKGETPHDQYYTGKCYPSETPLTSLAKAAGLILTGKYFFLTSTGYHLFQAGKQTVVAGTNIYNRWNAAGKPDLSTWIQNNGHEFKGATTSLIQAAKTGAAVLPFLFQPLAFDSLFSCDWEMGSYAWYGAMAYLAYHPQYAKVALNNIDDWICGQGSESTSSDSAQASMSFRTLTALLGQEISLSQLFGWQQFPCDQRSQQPRAFEGIGKEAIENVQRRILKGDLEVKKETGSPSSEPLGEGGLGFG